VRIISEFRCENYEEWLGSELHAAIGSEVEVEWVETSVNDCDSGIVAVHVMTPNGVVRLDYSVEKFYSYSRIEIS
jgi:hypothetical protein